MLESFSIQAVKIIENAKKIALEMNSKIVGTEHLLFAMYNEPDSICHFLLKELNIKYEDMENILKKMVVIHKLSNNNSMFSKRFQDIVLNASDLANQTKSDLVYDEHLFYSLLELKDSVAYEILETLNIDIEEMIIDIEEIFNFFEDDDNDDNPFPFLRLIKKENFHHPYVKRKDYVEQIIYILMKKQKNNPLLIGNAGVGKTSIIEGLSRVLKNEKIYELDLGTIVSGTKYRGELEEKLLKAMDYLKNNKAIVFIDEIHNIVGAGSNDGSLDVANILKPYLTKSNIKVIGATTIEEYYKFINKDKALSRRFQNIFIDEPNKKETFKILSKIKKHYEEYHNVVYDEKLLKTIINKCHLYMPNKAFPDKAIDVMDEVGAISNLNRKSNLTNITNKVVFNICGIKPKNLYRLNYVDLNYKNLVPLYMRFINKKNLYNNIMTIGINKTFKLHKLLEDLYKVFSITEECFLELDLESYTDATSINNLIGSSKGYVGYEQGGIFLEHVLRYPISIVYIKNIKKSHQQIQTFFDKVLQKPFIFDNKGRKVFFSNTIFIVEKNNKNKTQLGFINNKNENVKYNFDIEFDSVC